MWGASRNPPGWAPETRRTPRDDDRPPNFGRCNARDNAGQAMELADNDVALALLFDGGVPGDETGEADPTNGRLLTLVVQLAEPHEPPPQTLKIKTRPLVAVGDNVVRAVLASRGGLPLEDTSPVLPRCGCQAYVQARFG